MKDFDKRLIDIITHVRSFLSHEELHWASMLPQLGICHKRGQNQVFKSKKLGALSVFIVKTNHRQ